MKTTNSRSVRHLVLRVGCVVSLVGWSAALLAESNFNVIASRRLISNPISHRVTLASTFNETQGDRCVVSNLVTSYLPRLDFIPNAEKAQMSLVVDAGISASSIITVADDVRIYTTSNTVVSGQKSLFVENTGLTMRPSRASAATTMDIYDVKVRPFFPFTWLMLSRAWSAAEESKPEMEAAANLMAATKISAAMEDQVQEQMQKIDPRSLFSGISNVAVRERLLQELNFSTTNEHLMMQGDFEFGTRVAIDTPARLLSQETDLGVQIHQNALNGVAKILGGAVVTGQDLIRWFHLDSEAYLAEANINSLRVTLAQQDPLVFSLRDDVATVSLRLSSAELNGNDLGAISVQFAYRVSLANGKIQLDLVEGPVVLRAPAEPSPSDLPISLVMVADAMHLLSVVLHTQLTLGSLEDLKFLSMPEGVVARNLMFSEISFEDGWLNGGLSFRDL